MRGLRRVYWLLANPYVWAPLATAYAVWHIFQGEWDNAAIDASIALMWGWRIENPIVLTRGSS